MRFNSGPSHDGWTDVSPPTPTDPTVTGPEDTTEKVAPRLYPLAVQTLLTDSARFVSCSLLRTVGEVIKQDPRDTQSIRRYVKFTL